MKTKKLKLSINIPADYKYLCFQPWGGIVLFKKKPKIYSEMENWGKPILVENWTYQPGEREIDLFTNLNKIKNWKKIKKI